MLKYIQQSKTEYKRPEQPYLDDFYKACIYLDKAALRKFFQKDMFREITDQERRKRIIRSMTMELLQRGYLTELAQLEHKLGMQHILNSLDENLKKKYQDYRQVVNSPRKQMVPFDKRPQNRPTNWLKKIIISLILALIGFIIAVLKYLRRKKTDNLSKAKEITQ